MARTKPSNDPKLFPTTDKQLIAEMRSFTDLCFGILCERLCKERGVSEAEITFGALAEEIGCCYATARNLWYHETRFPRFMTVQKLGLAAGLNICTKTGRVSDTPALKIA